MIGVLILVGGASSRMGEDKATQIWGGQRAVDRLAALGPALGASALLTVGGRAYGLPHVEDFTPGGGPVAGLAAGVEALRGAACKRAVALAVDAPTIRADDLTPLLEASSPGAAFDGLHLPIVFDLTAAPVDAGAGWSVRRFVERMGLMRLPCPADALHRLRGANTPDERRRLLAEYGPHPD